MIEQITRVLSNAISRKNQFRLLAVSLIGNGILGGILYMRKEKKVSLPEVIQTAEKYKVLNAKILPFLGGSWDNRGTAFLEGGELFGVASTSKIDIKDADSTRPIKEMASALEDSITKFKTNLNMPQSAKCIFWVPTKKHQCIVLAWPQEAES